MSINAADIMRQAYETAQAVKEGKLDPEGGMAVAALVGKQVDVMRTVVDYMRLTGDPDLTQKAGDVFVGTETPRSLLTDSKPRR